MSGPKQRYVTYVHRVATVAPMDLILKRCEDWGIDPTKIDTLDDKWRWRVLHHEPVTPAPLPPHLSPRAARIYSRLHPHRKHTNYPYPPNVEVNSPEHCRLRHARVRECRRARKEGREPFMEGYHDRDTYTPKSSPVARSASALKIRARRAAMLEKRKTDPDFIAACDHYEAVHGVRPTDFATFDPEASHALEKANPSRPPSSRTGESGH